MSDWIKTLGILYAMVIVSFAYAGVVVVSMALVSDWMLLPGVALMPLLAMGAITLFVRD